MLSHDPKLDDPALSEALRSDVFYIGAAGPAEIALSILAQMTRVLRQGA